MRKRISEQNIFPDFDLYNEYRKIEMLLSEKKMVGAYNKFGELIYDYFTMEEYLEYICFNNWNLRGTFLDVAEMRKSLGIAKEMITPININKNQILDFLQYAINCVYRISQSMKEAKDSLFSDDTIAVVIWENIEKLIEKLDCHPMFDKDNKEIFLLYNDATASVVSKNYTDVRDSINEYIQIDNRGDITRKAEILCTLYKELELYGEQLKGTTYKTLFSDTKFLFNNTGIRHTVERDTDICSVFKNMNDKELEAWYDKAFDMFLSCMVIVKYLENKKDIDNIKRGIALEGPEG